MKKFENPVVVVGSGISGLNFALSACRTRPVIILTKKEIVESSTNYAQGGVAAVLDQLDSFALHIEDTMKAGSHHNNKEAVEFMVKKGPDAIKSLIDYGVHFQRFEGKLALALEGGHSNRRVAFVGDYTGRDIEESLINNVNESKNIEVIEHACALDVVKHKGKVAGIFYEHDGKIKFISTDTVVLATGGVGQLFEYTTNPIISTGDGVAIALRAGCKVRDMEFVQFHPTAFFPPDGSRAFMISEAVRGEGAILVNSYGDTFVDPLAPRDKVSQAIFEEMKNGQVYLDTRHLDQEELHMRFPTIYEALREHGVIMGEDLIPIQPAAHYLCGGVVIDFKGQTCVPGLFAFGEVAYTGVHGANRLASNSLLEALVFSSRVAYLINNKSESEGENLSDFAAPQFMTKLDLSLDYGTKIEAFQKMMQQNLGICRNNSGLLEARAFIEKELQSIESDSYEISGKTPDNFIEAQTYLNMLTAGNEIAKAALARKESLGCHLVV